MEGAVLIADDPFAHREVLLELIPIHFLPSDCGFLKFLHLSVHPLPYELHQEVELIVFEFAQVLRYVGKQLPLQRYRVLSPEEGKVGEDQLEVGLAFGGVLEDLLEELEACELERDIFGGLCDGKFNEGGEGRHFEEMYDTF